MNENLYKETILEFEKIRTLQNLNLSQRKNEIHKVIPRIKEIENKLNSLGLELTKNLIINSTNKDELIHNFEQIVQSLKDEEKTLLLKYKYPADYLYNNYNCNKCNDTGFYEGKICSCFTKVLINKYYKQSNLDKILDVENFDNFRLDFYDMSSNNDNASPNLTIQNIFSKAVNFVEKFDTNNDNLYLYGNPGLGKTYISHCIAKDLLDRGFSVIYQTATDLIDFIRKSKFDQINNTPMIDCLYDCDLLIIDDLGTENLTEFANNELFNLMNKRLKDNKSHIISTNLSLPALENRYNPRLSSRILGNFIFLKFIGQDIRLKKAKIL